jgi:hypothetical protein
MAEEITYGAFAAHKGESFEIQAGPGETVAVVLASATVIGGAASPSRAAAETEAESFSLEFRGPRARFLAQGTYQLEHPALGSFPLFIVPVGLEGEEYRYEAVFNRLPRPRASTP